ncbi:Carbohydrate binding domain protein [Paenibacillus sp. P1XP2]|nr:Carbohydrate binding domain protein [Paenibacillus sp. P1XP2]
MRWSDDGLLYVLFNNKLTVIDPETMESRMVTTAARFELGKDGHLYFTDQATNTILYRIRAGGEIVESPPGTPLPVTNAGFEEALSGGMIPGWASLFAVGSDVNHAVSTDRSFSGGASLKLGDGTRTASVALQSDKIPVTPGKKYTAGVQVYVESGQPGVMLRFFDAGNRTLSTLETHLDESRLAQWQEVTLSGAAPADAAYARLIAVVSRYNMASAYYDDFAFQWKGRNSRKIRMRRFPSRLPCPTRMKPGGSTATQAFGSMLQTARAAALQASRMPPPERCGRIPSGSRGVQHFSR